MTPSRYAGPALGFLSKKWGNIILPLHGSSVRNRCGCVMRPPCPSFLYITECTDIEKDFGIGGKGALMHEISSALMRNRSYWTGGVVYRQLWQSFNFITSAKLKLNNKLAYDPSIGWPYGSLNNQRLIAIKQYDSTPAVLLRTTRHFFQSHGGIS